MVLAILAIAVCNEARVDYNKEPYQALRDVLGRSGIENSDTCDDKVNHITVATDPILNRRVHLYTLHVHDSYKDGDRCNGDYGRQRCETSVQGSSPSWMKGDKGKNYTYAWKLYLEKISKNQVSFVTYIKSNLMVPALEILI